MTQMAAAPADDGFHPAPTNDPYWTETCWYSFFVPERRLSGCLYSIFRPNLGIASSSVSVWDDTADEPWAVPYAKTFWHLPMPAGDLTRCSLASGLEHECTEPLRRYHVRYTDGDEIALDLAYEGLVAPHAVAMAPERGHLDQACRVTGALRLHGQDLAVDCLAMRDRSWSVRADTGAMRAGYSYGAASEVLAFHAMSLFMGEEGSGEDVVLAGYLLRDGELADVVSGRRRVLARDRGRPTRVAIAVQDRLGRALHAEGECVNRLAFQASPNLQVWMSLTRWSFDGTTGWGEDQDIWSPDLWRRFARSAPRAFSGGCLGA